MPPARYLSAASTLAELGDDVGYMAEAIQVRLRLGRPPADVPLRLWNLVKGFTDLRDQLERLLEQLAPPPPLRPDRTPGYKPRRGRGIRLNGSTPFPDTTESTDAES